MKQNYLKWIMFLLPIVLIGLYFIVNNARDRVEVDWSPKGEWLVFFCGIFPNTDPKSNLYIMRPDGSELQRITTDDFVAKDPSWSPDGQWITFLSDDTIFKTKPDGSQVERVIILPLSPLEVLGSVELSPDGNLALYGVADFYGSYIRRIGIHDGDIQTLVSASDLVERQKWSPDGEFIAYAEVSALPSSGIYIVDKNGNERNLVLEDLGLKGQLNWTADGTELVVSLPSNQRRQLYRFNLKNNDLTPIELDHFWDSPAPSPNGEWIAYSGYNERWGSQIYKARYDGSDEQQLTELSDCGGAYDPRWFDFSAINS